MLRTAVGSLLGDVMKRTVVVVFALIACTQSYAGWFESATFDGCVLDKMPGVSNALAAKLVLASCVSFARANSGSGRGFFAKYASGADCFADKGKSVGDQLGATYVFAACHQLYDRPELDPSKIVPDEPRSK